MADVQAGIYQHYKGPLYLVLGLAHDANAEQLSTWEVDPRTSLPNYRGVGERKVVVYIALQLDGAHLGPRLAVRTFEDFVMSVCTNVMHPHYGELPRNADTCKPHRRFEYLGPELTQEMTDA